MHSFPHPRYHDTGAGYLRISGADRLEFIQRQTTNDVSVLSRNGHVSTVLTNPSARILDVLQFYTGDEEAFNGITLPGRGAGTTEFLKNRIFFNDRVAVEGASGSVKVIDLIGPGEAFSIPGGDPITASEGAVQVLSYQGERLSVLGMTGPLGPVRRLIAPNRIARALSDHFDANGAAPISPDEYDILRVEAGLPGPMAELTEDYTPLEIGLIDLISEEKGCYTGQEVISRQITYDKITRSMVGIQLDQAVTTGARIEAAGSRVGSITSYVHSPRLGHIALGVIKRPHTDPGTAVQVGDGAAAGRVVDLPFSN